MFRPLLGHRQALQENQTKFLNCLDMDPYYDLLSPLSLANPPFDECGLVISNRLCGLVVRVSGYRSRGAGFDSRRYHIFL
jgi:hypothetical protein